MKKTNGFSLIYIVAALSVVVIIIVAGLLVHSHSKKSSDSNNSSNSSKTQPQTSPDTEKQAEQKYMVISEWKVKLPLSDAISDAYYIVSTGSKDENGQPDGIWLGLKSLDSKGCEATQANSGGKYPIGALIKKGLNDTDPVTGVAYTKQEPNGIIIGQYYYAYHSGVQGSTTDCTTNADIPNINTVDESFKEAAKNIVAE